MNVSRTIRFLIKRQARMDERREAAFRKAMRCSALAERQMVRLGREMSRTDRIVTRLVRGATSPSEERRMDKNLARTVKNIVRIERSLGRLTQRPSKGNGRRSSGGTT